MDSASEKLPGCCCSALRRSAATSSISGRSLRVLQEEHGEHARAQPGSSGDGEVFVDRGIGLQNRIEFVLEFALLMRVRRLPAQ